MKTADILKKGIVLTVLTAFMTVQAGFCIQDVPSEKKSFFSIFKRNKDEAVLDKTKEKKVKKGQIEEVELPAVFSLRGHQQELSVMTIDDCVQYAIKHSPSLSIALERVDAAKSGIGQAKSNYAPRLTARVNYNHADNSGSRIANTHSNSLGFNVGVSEMIWDFGRTRARINMAKYDTMSAQYDYDYDLLNLIYDVRIAYYRVLMALANLDIYEQNVRINTLNYERTKAMFDEGLKSKIDVVNAEVNLADAKIQLVEGQNVLAENVFSLENVMHYHEPHGFVVANTENFGFLKSDYKKKMQSLDEIKPSGYMFKKNEDGLITLTSGIEHNDIIQDYELSPFKLTRQEAVNKALDLRPDLKSERMLVKVQEESLKAIRRQYAPEVTGDLSWGYTRSENGVYSSPLQVGAGIGLGSINPYSIHYQVQEGEAMLDIASHNLNIAKTDIYWEVQSNYVNMRQIERKIPLMHQKVKATLENFELADGRYSVGLNNYVELQDALANYNNSQLSFVEAVFEYNTARETLLRSMGISENN